MGRTLIGVEGVAETGAAAVEAGDAHFGSRMQHQDEQVQMPLAPEFQRTFGFGGVQCFALLLGTGGQCARGGLGMPYAQCEVRKLVD